MQLKTTNLHQLLSDVGLTYNEADVYLYLTLHGETQGPRIFHELGMDKSSCYRALNRLVEANLVYFMGEERNRNYGALDTGHLDELVNREEKKIMQAKKALSTLKTTVDAYIGSRYRNKRIHVITDTPGYLQYLESRLQTQTPLIRDLSGRVNASVFFEDYDSAMADYISRRVEKGIFLRQLSHPDQIDEKWDRSSPKMKKEVRILPKDFNTDAVFSAWDNKSAFFSKESGKVIGVVIEDPLITNVLISMFDFIWEECEKA